MRQCTPQYTALYHSMSPDLVLIPPHTIARQNSIVYLYILVYTDTDWVYWCLCKYKRVQNILKKYAWLQDSNWLSHAECTAALTAALQALILLNCSTWYNCMISGAVTKRLVLDVRRGPRCAHAPAMTSPARASESTWISRPRFLLDAGVWSSNVKQDCHPIASEKQATAGQLAGWSAADLD